MSERKARAMRRAFQRDYLEAAERLAEHDMNIFKPKLRWVPMWLWIWGLGVFVKIKRTKK